MRGGAVVVWALAAACGSPSSPPSVARAWPVGDRMMSAAAWGPDSAGLARALDAVRDSVERIDSLLGGRGRGGRVGAVDSLQREVRHRTGVALAGGDVAAGYALDRAALALAGVADSALLDLDGQFLWVGPPRPTRRAVGIADPDNSLSGLATVELWNGSVRTAAPRRGQPGRARSVTVLAPTATAAQAWSTAFLALGCDSALAMAPRLERWRVSVVCADSTGVRWTADLEQRVVLPTGAGEPPAPAP